MQLATDLAQGITVLGFAIYGLMALLSDRMVGEFHRFGLARLRVVTATLQVAGSLGMIAGHFASRPLLLLSAGGFALMMLLAIHVRVKIRDPVHTMIPAVVLMLLNLFILFAG